MTEDERMLAGDARASAERGLEIYKLEEGELVFEFDRDEETIWATQAQMAELFDTDLSVISRHLRNIYREGELSEGADERTLAKNARVGVEGEDRTRKKSLQVGNRTIKRNLIVRMEGKRQVRREVKMYNLDAIISVGYRVNSRKATDFRIWATRVLRTYLTKGVAVNERRLKSLAAKKLHEVEGMMGVVRRLIARQALDAGEANGVLEVISKYAGSFKTLKEFDDGFIDLSGVNKGSRKGQKVLTEEMCEEVIAELRKSVGGGELFGKWRDESFSGSLVAIYQSFDGAELYPTLAEKAANLLYFVIKDHPFYDGNKRIGALLFIVFLTMNDFHLTRDGQTKISDRALTAMALLIAESEPSEKELIVSLVRKLLED